MDSQSIGSIKYDNKNIADQHNSLANLDG